MASIREVSTGKFQVSWYDLRGVRQRKILPKKQAQELYDQTCADKFFEKTGTGQTLKVNNKSDKLFFKDIALRYRDEHLKHTRATSNLYYVNILIKKWGDYKIKMLQTREFRKWIKFALGNPIQVPTKDSFKLYQLEASSIIKLIRYITAIFNWSIEEGLITTNPMPRITDTQLRKEFKRRKKFKPIILSLSEFFQLIKDWPDRIKNPAICCFFSGIRVSELSLIKWSKTNRELHRFEYDADEVKEADAKNVYYDPEVESILETCYINYIADGYTDDIVFHGKEGGLVSKDSFGHWVREWADKAAERDKNDKFKKVTPHTFRRSYRTRKDLEGADRKSVAANMGHHSAATSEIYNIMDDNRMSSVAGYSGTANEEVNKIIESLVETGNREGLSLTQIQAELRRAFTTQRKNFDQ